MADLRRLLMLAGMLTESVADDPHTNREIERRLDKHPKDQHAIMLDALVALKDAGPTGLAPREWAGKVRQIHGEDMEMGPILTTVKREFDFIVRKNAEGRFVWLTSGPDDDPTVGMDPNIAELVSLQVKLSSFALAAAHQLDTFTPAELGAAIRRDHPDLPAMAVNGYVNHFVDHFRSMLMPLGGGRYRVKSDPQAGVGTEGSMQRLRDIAKRAAEGNHDPNL